MTTIAFDGEVIASDSQSSTDFVDQNSAKKLFRKKGKVFGVAGDYAQCLAVIDWLMGEKKPTFNDDCFTVVVIEDGQAQIYCNEFYPYPAQPPFAFGSGGVFAMAAMLAGADAKRAVEIACQLDENSGGKVRQLTV